MFFVQKYSSSIYSSNLKDDQWNHNLDIIAAVALSGPFGSYLLRAKYSNDPLEYLKFLPIWERMVAEKAEKRKWHKDVDVKKISKLSLEYWVNDVCRSCVGKKHRPYKNESGEVVAGLLEDDPCDACNGTGKRVLKLNHNTLQHTLQMLEYLDHLLYRHGGETMKRMKSDMDF